MNRWITLFLFFSFIIFITELHSDIKHDLSQRLEKEYNIPIDYTNRIINNYTFKDSIIKAMDKPAESMPWDKYKNIFLNSKKISDGILYYYNHKNDILDVANYFNFPPEILVSIIGVESNYGKYNFSIKAIDALCTLAFHYQRRSSFFLNELQYFILYTYKNKINPYTVLSSYAGAIGLPQFMPSSIIKYGYDYDNDSVIDLTSSTKDALASVANYLIKMGWQKNSPVASYINLKNKTNIDKLLDKPVKVKSFVSKNITLELPIDNELHCKIIRIDKNEHEYDYWATFNNFSVLRSYNPSNKYALAVYLLSKELKKYFQGGL